MNFKTVLLYHLYLILIIAAATVSAVIELSFARQVGFAVYHLNFFSVVLGLAVYTLCYVLIWNRLAGPSWSRLRENRANPGWFVWMAFASLFAVIPYLINVIIVYIVMVGGSFDSMDPGHLILITLCISVIYPVALVIRGAVRKKHGITENVL
ncbi:MAG: hypothetical protein IKE53_00675 [Clostridiales bacterium]|nr:hypothetical protein [Clostridiales bacterium]